MNFMLKTFGKKKWGGGVNLNLEGLCFLFLCIENAFTAHKTHTHPPPPPKKKKKKKVCYLSHIIKIISHVEVRNKLSVNR